MALTCGVKHLYESLPRVITIWANTGSKLFDIVGSGKTDKNTLAKKDLYVTSFNLFNNNLSTLSVIKTNNSVFINFFVENLNKHLPRYAFYACFNSLSSRICHPHKPVYTMIQEIFVSLLTAFPHQMLWKLVPMLKVLFVNNIL